MIRAIPGSAFTRVQICDGASESSPQRDYLQETLTNRMVPGDGEVDLVGIIRALEATGARVGWDKEICSSFLDQLPGDEAVRRAVQATRSVLEQAEEAFLMREGHWRRDEGQVTLLPESDSGRERRND